MTPTTSLIPLRREVLPPVSLVDHAIDEALRDVVECGARPRPPTEKTLAAAKNRPRFAVWVALATTFAAGSALAVAASQHEIDRGSHGAAMGASP
jgi:hypothetical protein